MQATTFFGDLPNCKCIALWREVTSPTLPLSIKLYISFIWQKVKQCVKAPGPLVFVFVSMGPYGIKNFKTLILLHNFCQIWAKLQDKSGSKLGIKSYKCFEDLQKNKYFVAHWNFNMGAHGKIVKLAISWKRLILEWNEWKLRTYGSNECTCKDLRVGAFHVWFPEFSLRSFAALCKISDFQKLLCPQFASNNQTFQKACNGENTSYYVFGDLPNFKRFITWFGFKP